MMPGAEAPGRDGADLAWRVHPAAERPGLAVAIAALIVVLGLLAGLWMGSRYWAVFACGVLFLSLEAFFLPAAYELRADGVHVGKPFSRVIRPWPAIRRMAVDPQGITLSPFRRRSWLEPYRAVRLRFRRAAAGGEDPTAGAARRYLLARLDPAEVVIEGVASEEIAAARGGAISGTGEAR